MRKGVFFFLLCFLATALSAQSGEFLPGYIVSTNQDTTYGFIKDANRTRIGTAIQFKTDLAKADPTTYTPEELSAFFFEPSFYFSAQDIELDEQPEKRFLRKLVVGYASLYQYVYAEQSDKYDYLIVKASGERMQLSKNDRTEGNEYKEDKAYVGQLKYVLRECSDFVTKSVKFQYSPRGFIRAITKYNDCVAPQKESATLNENRKLMFRVGPSIAFQAYRVLTPGSINRIREFDEPDRGFRFGVLGELDFHSKFFVQTGVLYLANEIDREIDFTLDFVNVNTEFEHLMIPLMLKYRVLSKRTTPFLYAGAGRGIYLGGTQTIIRTDKISERVVADDIDEVDIDKLNYLVGGIGVSTILTNEMELSLSLEYNRTFMATNVASTAFTESFLVQAWSVNLTTLF